MRAVRSRNRISRERIRGDSDLNFSIHTPLSPSIGIQASFATSVSNMRAARGSAARRLGPFVLSTMFASDLDAVNARGAELLGSDIKSELFLDCLRDRRPYRMGLPSSRRAKIGDSRALCAAQHCFYQSDLAAFRRRLRFDLDFLTSRGPTHLRFANHLRFAFRSNLCISPQHFV